VLVDKLGWLARRVEENGERVKSSDKAAQLHATAYQIDNDADVFFTDLIQERVLQIDLGAIQGCFPPV
jgi:hypothetical protein